MFSAISYLQVTRRKRRDGTIRYRYTLRDLPGEPSYEQIRAQQSRDALESNLQNAAERLRQISAGGQRVAGEFTLSDLGDVLGQHYLPAPVVEYLFKSTDPLLIETDDPEFPWEIVRHRGATLGAIRAVSRSVPARQRPASGIDRWGSQRRALLVSDTLNDSPEALREVQELQKALAGYTDPYEVVALTGAQATRHAIGKALQSGVEFLHVAGHIVYRKNKRNESAIICADGEALTADDIQSLNGDYAFVYLSGCQGGRTAQSSAVVADELADYLLSSGGRKVEGLAAPFLDGGASIFISTLWRVRDAAAYAFAHAFYQQALQGMPLGEALRRVRETWLSDPAGDPTWGAYVMYGNPLLTLDGVRDPERLAEHATRIVSHYSLVSIPPRDMAASAPFRSDRVEKFFRRFAPDPEITLSAQARRALQETLHWVDQTRWSTISRFDLLVGMARSPDGMVARGLAALGVSTEQLCELNIQAYGQGKRRAEQPYVSPGVFAAIMRAMSVCAKRSETEMTEEDLVQALLGLPASGSIQAALQALHIEDSATLLAAARGEVASAHVPQPGKQRISSAGLLLSPRGRTKIDATPRRMLRDMRAEIETTVRLGTTRPFVGRESALFEVLRVLASTDDVPHVVVHGAPGVGSRALAYDLAVRVVTHPEAADTAAIANWGLAALRLTRRSEKVSEWLPDEVSSLRGPTIVLLEDLPALLTFEGVAETIRFMQEHPNLRLLATAHTDDYRQVRREFSAIADALTATLLEPPREEEALPMVTAHQSRLERHYQVTIDPNAVHAAVELWREEAPLELPGAGLARLERACARKVNQGADESLGAALNPAPLSAMMDVGGMATTRTGDDPLLIVTEQDVRKATP